MCNKTNPFAKRLIHLCFTKFVKEFKLFIIHVNNLVSIHFISAEIFSQTYLVLKIWVTESFTICVICAIVQQTSQWFIQSDNQKKAQENDREVCENWSFIFGKINKRLSINIKTQLKPKLQKIPKRSLFIICHIVSPCFTWILNSVE